jgi:hypothetical protein
LRKEEIGTFVELDIEAIRTTAIHIEEYEI